jgi:predicted AAA+ superfamily ATPase
LSYNELEAKKRIYAKKPRGNLWLLIGFVDVLLGLMKIKNVDLYVTGSNSKMLSSDILTEFKDRGDGSL